MKQFVFIVSMLALSCASVSSVERPLRILFFGDSITQQGDAPGGYVSLIRDSLRSHSPLYTVIGAGISGNKVPDLLARMEKDVLSKSPDVVVIYIGINDVWHNAFVSRGLHGTPKDEYRSGLTTLIRSFQKKGITVMLCTPTVIGERLNGGNEYDAMLDEYAEISRSVAANDQVSVCDLRRIFLDHLQQHNANDLPKGVLTYDGVHLSAEGNRLVAHSMLTSLSTAGILPTAR